MGRTSTAVFNVKYHFAWCTKKKKKIIVNEIKECLDECLRTVAEVREWEISNMNLMSNYIHIELSASPSESPTSIIKILKGVTAKRIFAKYPKLKKKWKGSLWNHSYYIGTEGSVTVEDIEKYIGNEKGDES